MGAGPDDDPDRLQRGPSSNAGTYNYKPFSGIRDLLGYIRVPDPGSPGVGFGSNPFIDIGAYQYVNLHPPEVTGVTATETSTSSSTARPRCLLHRRRQGGQPTRRR